MTVKLKLNSSGVIVAFFVCSIAQQTTPEERFLACIRFYLSTFAAGKNDSIPKKPYNPVLGETFYCLWDHPSLQQNDKEPLKVSAKKDGKFVIFLICTFSPGF